MNPIESAYVNALLADASYVSVSSGIVTNVMNARMTVSQTAFIAANFEVLDKVETPTPLGIGFDAVVWLGKTGTAYAGKTFVSMRDTQENVDFLDDAALAATGVPKDQIVSMVNWWLRRSTPATGVAGVPMLAKQIQYGPVGTGFYNSDGSEITVNRFSEASSVAATGLLSGVTVITGVNGHSLGGYLATAFTRLFGANVQSVSTYNSAGFSNVASANIENSYSIYKQTDFLTLGTTLEKLDSNMTKRLRVLDAVL